MRFLANRGAAIAVGQRQAPLRPADLRRTMKIALASPYDWSVPGGVNRHVSNLAQHYIRRGNDVRVIAPSSKRLRSQPEYLHIIGHSSIGLPASEVARLMISAAHGRSRSA